MQKITKCRNCNSDIIFLLTEKGRRIPVNPNLDDDKKKVTDNDSKFDSHRHIAHFATCPEAKLFRKSDKKKLEKVTA